MKCGHSDNWLTLEFEEQEKELLLFSLEEIVEHYAQDDTRMRTKFRQYWRGRLSRSEENERELGESSEDLHETRLGWKGERMVLVRKWLEEGGTLKNEGGGLLILDEGEAVQFLSVLNDRRLLLALEYTLDEELMAKNPAEVAMTELQQALWEIHFLAIVQQHVLEAIEGDREF